MVVLSSELSRSIAITESLIAKLSKKEEICISDIEFELVELRGALYKATSGNDPLFNTTHAVSIMDSDYKIQKYRFEWPYDALGHIQSIFVSENKLYASSASVLQLEAYPLSSGIGLYFKPPIGETTVLIGDINSTACTFRASKTNLKALQ